MSKEYASDQYDSIYASGGVERIYDLPYRHTGYYPLFKEVWRTLNAHGCKSILEVGCGTGAFAHLMLDRGHDLRYRGFDFSQVAVERAGARVRRPDLFFVADARSSASYQADFDAIVCTEVLEHIDADLDVVEKWAAGTFCVCSVPNFDADNHVRHFAAAEGVRERYGGLIEIEQIVAVKKPFLSDLSWRSRVRALRWNRYRPANLLAIAGLASFQQLGGWYVFSGRRSNALGQASK